MWNSFIQIPRLDINVLLITRKNFWPTKYQQQKILNPRNTHGKKFWTHEIATRKCLGTTKCQGKKVSDPQRHETYEIHDDTKFSTLFAILFNFIEVAGTNYLILKRCNGRYTLSILGDISEYHSYIFLCTNKDLHY